MDGSFVGIPRKAIQSNPQLLLSSDKDPDPGSPPFQKFRICGLEFRGLGL